MTRPRIPVEFKVRTLTITLPPEALKALDAIARDEERGNRSATVAKLVDEAVRRRSRQR
jgi:metal-responsive CopG/Arc/MetJ family transcriptional regulator